MDAFKNQFGFLVAIFGGVFVSMLASSRHSFKIAATRIFAGLFFAWFFTDPIIDWMHWDADTYRNSVAGLFAMMGYGVARIASNVTKDDFFKFVQLLRGGK